MAITLTILVVGVVIFFVSAFLLLLFWKSRPFATGAVFTASRLSRGNRLLPTQVLVSPASVVQYTPHWIGHHEQSIHMAHIASVRVDTSLLFSDVFIETTGGANAVHCRGHKKSDAEEMKRLIERYQGEYYRENTQPGALATHGPSGAQGPGATSRP